MAFYQAQAVVLLLLAAALMGSRADGNADHNERQHDCTIEIRRGQASWEAIHETYSRKAEQISNECLITMAWRLARACEKLDVGERFECALKLESVLEDTRFSDDDRSMIGFFALTRGLLAFNEYQNPGRVRVAEELFSRVNHLLEEEHGNERESFIPIMWSAEGRFYLRLGRTADAASVYERLLTWCRRTESAGFGEELDSLLTLGKIRELQNRPAEGEELFRDAITMIEKAFGKESRALVNPLTSEARMLEKLGRKEEAARLLKRVEVIRARDSELTEGSSILSHDFN